MGIILNEILIKTYDMIRTSELTKPCKPACGVMLFRQDREEDKWKKVGIAREKEYNHCIIRICSV